VWSLRFPARECSERLHMRANYCACVFRHAYMRIIRPESIGGNFSRVLELSALSFPSTRQIWSKDLKEKIYVINDCAVGRPLRAVYQHVLTTLTDICLYNSIVQGIACHGICSHLQRMRVLCKVSLCLMIFEQNIVKTSK
jgi:hypothetical protein